MAPRCELPFQASNMEALKSNAERDGMPAPESGLRCAGRRREGQDAGGCGCRSHDASRGGQCLPSTGGCRPGVPSGVWHYRCTGHHLPSNVYSTGQMPPRSHPSSRLGAPEFWPPCVDFICSSSGWHPQPALADIPQCTNHSSALCRQPWQGMLSKGLPCKLRCSGSAEAAGQ